MKKFILAITTILAYCQIIAQEEDHTHFEFMGIPIDGQISGIVEKLEQKGFTIVQTTDDGHVLMDGVFANNDSQILILVTPDTKIVWKIGVFPDKEYTNWASIKHDFNDMKSLYTRKYGEPALDRHYFSFPYELGDGFEMTALKMDKCTYYTSYELENGYISINMTSDCKIMIVYEDKQNAEINERESENAIFEDI